MQNNLKNDLTKIKYSEHRKYERTEKNRKKNEQEEETNCLAGVLCQKPEKQFTCKVLFSCYSELSLKSNQHGSCENSTLKPGISHVHLAFELHEVPLTPSSFLWNDRSPIKVSPIFLSVIRSELKSLS